MSGGKNRQQRRKASAGAAAQQQQANTTFPFPMPMPMPPHTRQDSTFGPPGGWRAGTPPTSAHQLSFAQQPGQSISIQPGQPGGSVSLPPGAFPGAYPFWQQPGAFSPAPTGIPTNVGRHGRGDSSHASKRQRYQGDGPIGIGHPGISNVTNIDHRSNPSATLRNRANLAILTDIPLSAGPGPISPALVRLPGTPGPPPGTPPALLPYNQRAYTLDSAGIQSLGHFPHSSLSMPIGSPLTRQGPGPLGNGPMPPPSPVMRRAVTTPSNLSQSHTRVTTSQQRLGPPPKAILGGPGGRTFEELRPSPNTSLKPTPAPSATPHSTTPLATNSQCQDANTLGDSDQEMATEATTTDIVPAALKEAVHNGNTVNVTLPPAKYSPPDSPAIESLVTQDAEGEEKDKATDSVVQRVPRKEAYPWPPMQVGVTPHSIPLPLSPISDDLSEVERAFSPQVATSPAKYKVVTWKGKEVRVAMPEESNWDALRPGPISMEIDDTDRPIENVDTLNTQNTTPSPPTSPSHMDRLDSINPTTPPTGEASLPTSPPGSSQWETAFESSTLSNSPPAFTAWEGPPTRSPTPSDGVPRYPISPIVEENADAEQLEHATEKTETATPTSEVGKITEKPTPAKPTLTLSLAGSGSGDDTMVATPRPKPKLYSEGAALEHDEHAALREVVLGAEQPIVVEGDDDSQTVVLDRLMSEIASPMPSPFRKSFSGLAANPFLKRSLGGMLRQPRSRRGSDAVPPTPTRLTQSTTADESVSPVADSVQSEIASEDAMRSVKSVSRDETEHRQITSLTPPSVNAVDLGTIASPKLFPSSASSCSPRQGASPRQASPSRQSSPKRHTASSAQQSVSPPMHFTPSPVRQPISPPSQFTFASPIRQPLSPPSSQFAAAQRYASPVRQPLSPPVTFSPPRQSPSRETLSPVRRNISPTRQPTSPSTSSPSSGTLSPFKGIAHVTQASIDHAMAQDSLAEALAAMKLAGAAQAPPAAPVAPAASAAPRPSNRIPQPPQQPPAAHWAFGPRRPSAPSSQEDPAKSAPASQESNDGDLSWRNRSAKTLPPINSDLQQLIRPDGGKLSERSRQDEGDHHEPVNSADEELKGDADATTLAEQPPTGVAAPKASQRGLRATSADMNEMVGSQPSSPLLHSSSIVPSTSTTSPIAVLSESSPFKTSLVLSVPNLSQEFPSYTAQPGGLSPPKRLQATTATFVPRPTYPASPETESFRPTPFTMGHSSKASDASSTFTFGPPSAQPSPGKIHRRSPSNMHRSTFQVPAGADPMPQEPVNNGLGLFTFTKQLRPNAIEFKPVGGAAKPRSSSSFTGSGFRPPALDLSAAAPSSRAFASFGPNQMTLGQPFEFKLAASKPALIIRKPNPIPILRPKGSSADEVIVSPHRQHASPRDDGVELPPVPSDKPRVNHSPEEARDSPRRGKHTCKRSSQNSHLPKAWLGRSQPATPVDTPSDAQIHQSMPIRLDSGGSSGKVRASSDGALKVPVQTPPAVSTGGGSSTRSVAEPSGEAKSQSSGPPPSMIQTVIMKRNISAPTILSAKAKPFLPSYAQGFSDLSPAKRLDAFLHHTPHSSNVNVEVADENKFRHWTFPQPDENSPSPPGADSRHLSFSQSHKRRHSDTEDVEGDEEPPSRAVSAVGGGASVAGEGMAMKWPNWPHSATVLSPTSHTYSTTDTSAEFPMRRTPPRRLSVVNTVVTPLRQSTPETVGIRSPIILPRGMLVEMLTTMQGVGEQVMQSRSDNQRLLDESTKRAEAAENQSIIATTALDMIKEYFAKARSRESVSEVLESHTELLKDHTALLQEIHQKIEEETRTSSADSAELVESTHIAERATNTNEMLTAILSGQHAMMSRFSEYTEAHDAVYDLRSATDALLEAQAEVRQVKLDQQHGHELVRLHDEIRSEATKSAQAEREVAALKSKLDIAESVGRNRELDDVWRALVRADVAAVTATLAKVTQAEEHARKELNAMRDQLASQSAAHQSAIEALHEERDATAKLADERHKELLEAQADAKVFRGKFVEHLEDLSLTLQQGLEKKRGEAELERETRAQDRIASLEMEVKELRAQLAQSANDRSDLKVQLTQAVADVRYEQEKAIRMADTEANAKRTMELQLKAEKARTSYLETKVQRAEADLSEVASNLDAWRSAALEQRMRAEQATTHVTALQQENFHWRQFALGADRHRLEEWLATKPFIGVDHQPASYPTPSKQTPPRPAAKPPSVLSPVSRPASPLKPKSTTPVVSSKLRMVVPVINEPDVEPTS
ncbi:hypothetical protein CC85DRAFT_198953 [Cutaneotrichosporon oleaginosum]|uniref:Uncharacterized protein n=2 Tax=Cutaneotrichosporon oleaginosum TaxID=879819 RepID=A0A0J1AVF2_9TREE|nr:uncharacterized protein CC85DRAFT_198953 [Cutaneotrichosporon oleaginosum]KLT39269.1 hypothetical protein CC85DRAFT_198953 [Cutaneotrichosporon oleaginosum]